MQSILGGFLITSRNKKKFLRLEIEDGGALGYVFLVPKPETPIFVVFRDLEMTQKKRGSSARRSGKTRSPCRTGEKVHKIFGFYKPFFLTTCFFGENPSRQKVTKRYKNRGFGPSPKIPQSQNARNLGKRSVFWGFWDSDAFLKIAIFRSFLAFGQTKKTKKREIRVVSTVDVLTFHMFYDIFPKVPRGTTLPSFFFFLFFGLVDRGGFFA